MNPENFILTEELVLAGLVASPQHIDEAVVMGLTTTDFVKDAHCRVWKAILALWNANSPLGLISLSTALQNEISDLGGYDYLPRLLDADPVGANVLYYVAVVRRRSLIRQLHQVGCRIRESTASGDGDAEHLLETAERDVLAVSETGIPGGAVRIGEGIDEVIAELDSHDDASLVGLTSSLAEVDAIIGGLRPAELIIVGARPATGKTALLLQTAAMVANLGKTVLFASLEMSLIEMRRRLIAFFGKVDTRDMRRREVTETDYEAVLRARKAIVDLPLWVDDCASQRLSRIAATARRLRRQHGLGLICVDYIQLIEPEDRRIPRHEQVALISRRLKGLSKDLNVPILCAAQLNRQSTDRVNNKPKLSDLRESGSIEADADIVMLLWRPDENQPNNIELNIAKNRHGPTAEFTLNFTGQFGTFRVV